MATDIQKTDLRGLLAKIQAVAGTPATLVAGDDGVIVLDSNYRFQTDKLTRNIDKPGHGARPFVNVKRRSMFEGGLELRGAAVNGAAAPCGTILRGCGFQQTLTPGVSAVYTLRTNPTTFEMLTLAGYRAGEVVNGMDARGALTSIEMSVRNFAQAKFNILGLPMTPVVADAALPSIDYSDFQAPIAIETESFEFDIGGVKLNAISLMVNTNAQVEIYEGSELRFVSLSEFYRPTGTLKVFKEQRSAFNPETISLAHTLSNCFATITGGGEIVRLDMNSVQLSPPEPGEESGIATWDIPFEIVGTTPSNCLQLSFLEIPT